MSAVPHARVDAVRAFNRFYTRRIGVLGDHLLDSPYSLTEMRVLYELVHRDRPTARELGRDLGLDAGYLSRILRRFEHAKLLTRAASKEDRRRSLLNLTSRGRLVFAPLNERARKDVAGMLEPLPDARQRDVVAAMQVIARQLGE